MISKLKKVLKNILGITLFYTAFFLLGYVTYYVFFPERTLTIRNFIGIYAILLQVAVLINVTTTKDDK